MVGEGIGSVSKRFSRGAKAYSERASVHRRIAAELVEHLPKDLQPKRILDLGCGSGFLTKALHTRFLESEIVGVDAAPEMVRFAEELQLGPRVTFAVGDARSVEIPGSFDLICSASALHWMRPFDTLFGRIRLLAQTPTTTFAAAIMMERTLDELHTLKSELFGAHSNEWRLPGDVEIKNDLRRAEFDLNSSSICDYREEFESATSFVRSLHSLGFTARQPEPLSLDERPRLLSRNKLSQLISAYDQRFVSPSGGVFATFRVGFYYARVFK